MTQELDTLMYKMLSYAKRCMEDGAYASIGEMEAFAKGNRVMFAEAVRECQEQKLLRGVVVRCYHDKPVPVVMGQNVAITLDGVNFMGPLITPNPAGMPQGHAFVEPYLIRIGFLKRTPQGREATPAAAAHLAAYHAGQCRS